MTGNAKGKLVPGETVTFTIQSNYEATVTLYGVARSKTILDKTYGILAGESKTVEIEVTSAMIPEARFVVFENLGENWAADSVSYFVEANLDNQVEITPRYKITKIILILIVYLFPNGTPYQKRLSL